MNKVVVGAPNEAAVPVCVFAVVGKQLSADAMFELLDDVLAELVLLLLEEVALVALEVLEVLEELEVADDKLLDELVLFDAAPVDTVLASPEAEEPPLQAVSSKHRLAKMLI